MKCFYHPEYEAVGTCLECGQAICSDCYGIRGGKLRCGSCFGKGTPSHKVDVIIKPLEDSRPVEGNKPAKKGRPRKSLEGSVKKEVIAKVDVNPMQNTSGQGKGTIVPPEIKGWNWGAFLMNWIWGIGNSVWIALICIVPFVNMVVPFVLGAKGSEWAWQSKRWDGIEHFQRTQKIWMYWGIGLVVVSFLLYVVSFVIGLSASIGNIF